MENFCESQSYRFRDGNIVHLGSKFVLNKNQSGWSTTSFIVRLAPLAGKASSTLMFRNAISLELVVGTYIGGAAPVYNGKNILGVPLGLS